MNKNTDQNNRRNFLSKMLITGVSGITLFSTSAFAKGGRNKTSATTLTAEQEEAIFFMYQEEKVARDVYITLGEIYPDENTFASIQLSEQRHIDSVEDLCDKYGISKKGVNEGGVGNFVLEELKELYDDCVSDGQESLLAALKVGELIELTDIKDLEEAAVGMPADVQTVFSSLKEGSLSHLDAFQAAISRTE